MTLPTEAHKKIKEISKNLDGVEKKYATQIMMALSRCKRDIVLNLQPPDTDAAREISEIARDWSLS